ncbi:MAG: alpha/beta hydrolase [Candidatus Aminicenantes bacterium]
MNKRDFFASGIQPGKAVTIAVPGLNMKPGAFLELVNFLTQQGSDVILVHLTGHGNDSQNLGEITRQAWWSDLLEAHQYAGTLIRNNPTPLYFIGFSLGSLVNLDALSHYPGIVHYDKMALLAPANALRRRSHLIKFFFLLGRKFGIPSRQPKKYRCWDKTPVQAYKVLFEMKKAIENQNYLNLNIPTLVFIDENDELISLGNLKKIINKYQLTHWDVCTLDSQYVGENTGYHHLIVDENTMGTGNWHRFQSGIKAFFNL